MRVLYDHQIFSYQAFGGASRYYCEIMREFHQHAMLKFDLGVSLSPNEYLQQAPFYQGKSCSRNQNKLMFFTTYLINQFNTRRLLRTKAYDIVHATFYDPVSINRPTGTKLVTTILDMIPEHFPEMFNIHSLYGRFVTKRWIAGKREICAKADIIIAISEQTKTDIIHFYGTNPDKIEVAHLGSRLTYDAALSHQPHLPKKYILFVGTRNTYKNFHVFLQAAAAFINRNPDFHVLCVGGGPFTNAEMELIQGLHIHERIIQMNVRDDELAACYANALAFVFPSRYEGFGIPIIEAFSCGCPAILAKASCFPEIGGAAALYFPPDDHVVLAAMLQLVRDNSDLRHQLIKMGRNQATQFTWEKTANKTMDIYQSLLMASLR